MRILVAPDSFKGTAAAIEVAEALAAGWKAVRGNDDIVLLPQADGGEGTLSAVAASASWQWHQTVVDGPDGGTVSARWLLDCGGRHPRAVVELAESSGIALMSRLDPWRADSRGLGQVIGAALRAGAWSVQVGLGGSASTDGGAGALMALGLKAFDSYGHPMGAGASGLRDVDRVEVDGLTLRPLAARDEAQARAAVAELSQDGFAFLMGYEEEGDFTAVREAFARDARGDTDPRWVRSSMLAAEDAEGALRQDVGQWAVAGGRGGLSHG